MSFMQALHHLCNSLFLFLFWRILEPFKISILNIVQYPLNSIYITLNECNNVPIQYCNHKCNNASIRTQQTFVFKLEDLIILHKTLAFDQFRIVKSFYFVQFILVISKPQFFLPHMGISGPICCLENSIFIFFVPCPSRLGEKKL